MKKKIVFLADCLVTQKAGIHFYAKQFINRIITQYPDNQYYVVLPYSYDALTITQIIVPIKHFIPFHFRLRSFISIPRALKEIQPDLVVEMAHFGPFNLPKTTKRATVIHDLTPINFPKWHDRMSTVMHKLFLPSILDNTDYIIANSELTKTDLIAYRGDIKSKISVAYPQIEKSQKKATLDLTSVLESENYLLSVGTIEPRKNYFRLLKAFDKLASKYSDLKLRIVGYKGWKSDSVYNLIERSSFQDRIILEGYTSQERLNALYSHASVFVFPSLYEGFGLPLLEAMAYSLPIVCSDLPTSREICQDAALYFDKENDGELAKQLISLLQNKEKRHLASNLSANRFIVFNNIPLELDHIFGADS